VSAVTSRSLSALGQAIISSRQPLKYLSFDCDNLAKVKKPEPKCGAGGN